MTTATTHKTPGEITMQITFYFNKKKMTCAAIHNLKQVTPESIRLHKPLSKTNAGKFTVANKGVDIYYSLTEEIRDSWSSYSFKRKLRIFIMREEVE